MGYSNTAWLKAQGKQVSAFGSRVAEILGYLYEGIYHIDQEARKTDWSKDNYVEITLWSTGMATFDGSMLTRLVVACHDKAIRCEIQPRSYQYFRLVFHPRKRNSTNNFDRHPSMEEAVEKIRASIV